MINIDNYIKDEISKVDKVLTNLEDDVKDLQSMIDEVEYNLYQAIHYESKYQLGVFRKSLYAKQDEHFNSYLKVMDLYNF